MLRPRIPDLLNDMQAAGIDWRVIEDGGKLFLEIEADDEPDEHMQLRIRYNKWSLVWWWLSREDVLT